MKTRLFLSAVVLTALTFAATAQTNNQTNVPAGQGRNHGAAWVDGNNDGICDNFEKGAPAAKGRMNGQRAGKGNMQHRGKGITRGSGQGRGNGQGRFNGKGPGFIDADKDGICDNAKTPVKN
jgi:Spy/CpxP family protein refolding chaperone